MRNIIDKIKELTLVEIIVGVCVLFVFGSIIATPFIDRATEDTVIITVTDKTVKRHGDSDDKYLIYTNDTTYEITDSLAYFRFDSSDLYGKIEVGKTYECKVCGWRIPLLSSYKNIITATEVE